MRAAVAAVLGAIVAPGCASTVPPPGPRTVTIGGTVHGLAGSGLVLHDGAGDQVAIAADGAFAFPAAVAAGTAVAVIVAAQPTTPWQTCTIAGGDAPSIAADLTAVEVTCTTSRGAIGGNVVGLTGPGLVLQLDGGGDLAIDADGAFRFAAPLASGQAFHVAIAAAPTRPGETCAVFGGDGTVGPGDVTTVLVRCSTTGFVVGGTVTGLAASGLTLQLDGGDDLEVDADGGFAFAAPVPSGAPYHVTVAAAPRSPAQGCTVAGGDGVVGDGDVTTVAISCATNQYTVGGTVSGLAGGALVLQDNGGDDLTVTADGAFAFPTAIASGAGFEVTVEEPARRAGPDLLDRRRRRARRRGRRHPGRRGLPGHGPDDAGAAGDIARVRDQGRRAVVLGPERSRTAGRRHDGVAGGARADRRGGDLGRARRGRPAHVRDPRRRVAVVLG